MNLNCSSAACVPPLPLQAFPLVIANALQCAVIWAWLGTDAFRPIAKLSAGNKRNRVRPALELMLDDKYVNARWSSAAQGMRTVEGNVPEQLLRLRWTPITHAHHFKREYLASMRLGYPENDVLIKPIILSVSQPAVAGAVVKALTQTVPLT